MQIAELLEILMVLCFGASWPLNVIKSYKARTAKGKSLAFLALVAVGYLFGIGSKLMADSFKWYVLFFYVLNLAMVCVDMLLYWRNWKLDRRSGEC